MTIAAYLTGLRWVDEPVLAAGQLRQGRGILDFLRPRRCRQLPRGFVLAVTRTRVVAFEAWGDAAGIGIKPGVRAAFPRDEVQLADLAQGRPPRRRPRASATSASPSRGRASRPPGTPMS
jgi:hypothetical protein